MVEVMSLESRAAIHAALAEPSRLAMVDALVLSDASPGELGEALGLSSSLLAHHLRVLEDAGVVQRARSEADRRRTYVRLVPSVLAGLSPISHAQMLAAARVLFVCTHNSARSQLAAALWNRRAGLPAASAGTDPSRSVHHRAISTARRHGLPLDGGRTAHLRDIAEPGDLVVTVCDNAYEELGSRSRLHWSVPDPVRADTDEAFDATFDELATRISRLARAVDPTSTPVPTSSKEDS